MYNVDMIIFKEDSIMKRKKTIRTTAAAVILACMLPAAATASPQYVYDDITAEVNQIRGYIDSGLYLEAMRDSQQTKAWHRLSEADIQLMDSYYNEALTKYNEYVESLSITLGYGAPIQYGKSYFISPENAQKIIKQRYGIDAVHTMTGNTMFWFEGGGYTFAVERWYDTPDINLVTIYVS
jgi:hypothetical protein